MTTHAPRAGRDRPPGPMFHAIRDQREVHPMNAHVQFLQAVHADRLARLHAEATAPERTIEHVTPAGSR
jgi:hypothetical protein